LKKIVIFGNSGSGKSTLAKRLCAAEKLSHLDLDTIAWLPTVPPERATLEQSALKIHKFIELKQGWVIEGCYSDLLELALPSSNEMIFMNLPVELCIENARNRPWESHKYESKAAQDSNLEMLIDWISQYSERNDTFSQLAHNQLYEKYAGKKSLVTRNQS
jgi:adenylate kinase family enzyme